MFRKIPLINANVYKQDESNFFVLNRFFKTIDQTEKIKQSQAPFIQMPPNNYIYNPYSNSIQSIATQYEIRYPVLKENNYHRNYSYLYDSLKPQKTKYEDFQTNVLKPQSDFNLVHKSQNNNVKPTNDKFSFKYPPKNIIRDPKFTENTIDKSFSYKKTTNFGLKNNIETLKPRVYAKKSAMVPATVSNKILTQNKSKIEEKVLKMVENQPKIESLNDLSAFKPVKNPNEFIKITASKSLKDKQEIKINQEPKQLVQTTKISQAESKNATVQVSSTPRPAFFQPIQPSARLLLKKKLSQPPSELCKLLLSNNPRLPPPFSNTKKLYEDHKKVGRDVETEKFHNFKDLKSIGFKLFKKNFYVKDKQEKFPHTILDYLIKKSRQEQDTLRLENKSSSIIFSVPNKPINHLHHEVTTIGKKHSDTEILIDRYLHKQRA